MSLNIKFKENAESFIIEIPKTVPKEVIRQLLKRLEMEEIATQIKLSEKEINDLADQAKRAWWEKEGKKILIEKGILSED
ncbi:hypothetical protein [Thermosulfurimonas dismutans]|uniref:Uncharacterized protein n=1 Tax=Thermosulfurimonas dismutans TaxID=999894 RepID=A0A179D3V4_9BACT|nr:hypothetical protein [Thermosulfurimonas dismutans]OAQ20764.1 hypothetical protein TDIS_1220 [Thermosulfurimonas dismutans]